MKHCKRCMMPDTRPNVFLNDKGLCSACVGHDEKEDVIDWDLRKKQFEEIVDQFKGKNYPGYDCIIPVSGGKDSTYQVYMMKTVYKMNPLCITYKTPGRTELGQVNLDNLIRLGVDHIDFTINPETERKFMLKTLKQEGAIGISFHLCMFAYTLKMACKLGIPLIVWGENSQLEYGGSTDDRENPYLDTEWLKKHGCLEGKGAEDWADDELTLQNLYPYQIPSDEELKKAKIQSVFIGYYFKWDPIENLNIAKKVGFKVREEGPVMGTYNFADIDDHFISTHHYPKWLKFGMTRTFDNVAIEIRNGRMTKEEGLRYIKANKDDFPLREQFDFVINFLRISEEEFFDIIEKFRNTDIWKKDENGEWYIPGYLEGIDVNETL